jgi:hypothetical protein
LKKKKERGNKMFASLISKLHNNIIQIHSSKRKDRKLMTDLWTAQHQIQLPIMEAIMKDNGAEGCTASHKAVAEKFSTPYLVLEDDALPTLALYDTQLLYSIIKIIESQEFDILYLGGLPAATRVLETSYYGVLEGKCGATYAMIVFPQANQWLRKHSWKGIPIDVEIVRNKQLRTAFVHPPLFTMAQTASDIGKNAFNKSETFAKILFQIHPVWRFVIVWQKELFVFVFFLILLFLLKAKFKEWLL